MRSRQVGTMKKDKEADEGGSVYSTDSYLAYIATYVWLAGGFKYRELDRTSSSVGILLGTMPIPNTHCFLTHSSLCSPSMSGHICECSH